MAEAAPAPCRVFTGRVGAYRAEDGLDVSRAGAHPLGVAFAPSWGLLRPYLARRRQRRSSAEAAADWARYEAAYLAELRARYRADRAPFAALLARPEVTLLCHCPGPEQCHRGSLARVLVKLGAVYEGERPAPGERVETAAADLEALAAHPLVRAAAEALGAVLRRPPLAAGPRRPSPSGMTVAAAAVPAKACKQCGGAGPFHRKAGTYDGLDSRCKACKTGQVVASERKHKPKYLERKQVTRASARARRAGVGGTLAAADWRGLLDLFGHRCGWCGASDVPLELEHVYPLARGGSNDPTNVAPACGDCNHGKGAALPLTWFFGLDLPF
jgi:5-methylcytosine-specific restriction endonuclease McrA/uncharacterized protein YeaO (DUF488 family)